jgi:FkbH-like protein
MSRRFFKGAIFAVLVSNVTAAVVLVGPMLLAAAGVGALLFLVGAWSNWHWFAWVIAAPVAYLSWVILYLATSAVIIWQIGSRHPKPRHVVMRPGQSRSPAALGVSTAAWCYGLFHLVERLPFARAMGWIPCLSTLWMRAYSPALHLGNDVMNLGFIIDPDLTEVGDHAVIGRASALTAHAMVVREDGILVFTSAPIKIGRRVTIGSEAYVALGCVIGDDAVLEPRAVLAPFTKIPAGEVWGGNPALFLRKRNAAEVAQHGAKTAVAIPPSDTDADVSPGLSSCTSSVSIDAVRDLVIDALRLAPGKAPVELSRETCAEWDSLGQVAIAASLFDRYGIGIDGEDVFQISTLREIADLIARESHEPAHSDQRKHGAIDRKIASVQEVGADASSVLPDDIEMLPLMDPREATRALAARFDSTPAGAQHLRVCIAASFTVQQVEPTLRLWGRAFGLEIECCIAEYDQIVQTLLDPGRQFVGNRDGVNVVLTRLEDLVSDDADEATTRMDDLLKALRSFAGDTASRGQLVVGTLPPVVSAFSDVSERRASALRYRWATALEQLPGVEPFPFGRVVEHLGIESARSSQNEVLAHAPYSPRLYQGLGIELVRSILATRRASAKVIVLDCDNTLWGGIVGEVGLEGIHLGSDGPGRSFQLFQRYLKKLQARGFLLVVASRNEQNDVREVFEKHPEMVLRPDDIAAWRVSWERKSQNIRALAEELRLGVDSFVFLDDDPVARLEVQSLVPGVHVVPLPSDPSRYCETLARLWLFDGVRPTAVDAARTRMMHEETRRQGEEKSFRSLDQFLAGLELRVEIGPPGEQEWGRVAQLTQRTNQFSLSLKRRTLEQLKSLAAGQLVMVLTAQDRFGDYGLVGTCILVPPDHSGACEIDTLLMSCRALGRGVEDAFLYGVAAVAARWGASKLVARYIEGPRNAQIRPFLARHGFTEVHSDVFSLPLEEVSPLPAHVQFIDREVPECERTSLSLISRNAHATAPVEQ